MNATDPETPGWNAAAQKASPQDVALIEAALRDMESEDAAQAAILGIISMLLSIRAVSKNSEKPGNDAENINN
jgi:hypothetical protein